MAEFWVILSQTLRSYFQLIRPQIEVVFNQKLLRIIKFISSLMGPANGSKSRYSTDHVFKVFIHDFEFIKNSVLRTALRVVLHGASDPWRHLAPKKCAHGHSQAKCERSLQ